MLLLLQISMNAKMTTAAAVMNVLTTMADTTARVLSHFNSLTMIETVEVRKRMRFGFPASAPFSSGIFALILHIITHSHKFEDEKC